MTTPLKPPTSASGYVSDSLYGEIVDELTYGLPADLAFPASAGTYATMAREAHLSAVINGYTLQLRRAQWQLDGRGCRPEVVRLVADDLGLPVMGEDTERTGARTRGVSWNHHLRAALLSLTYGCYGFALQADLSGGQARLTGLFDRTPWTISRIHADGRTGEFQGVSQDAAWDRKTPQIKAENMAWYCHEPVGGNWSGVSILRSSWPSWVIKREMLRVHASANRRWGLGVPVLSALPGTNPTAAQMQDAQRLASAARAGDQSGAAVPPDFEMKIVGITGQVPDTLGFLNYLNREMAVACLMPHLEVGVTAGARSLADSFIDSWLLALGAIAEEVCDVATRQIAARVVEWNHGPDEPVPAVVASGIGARREVTAESLHQLLQAGALSADPALEAWVRREYRLPERETPPPAPVTPPPAPVAASARPRARRRKAPAQPTLFAAAEDPEPATDFAALQAQWEQAKADLLAEWPEAAQPMVDDLSAQVEAAVAADDLGALGSLAVSAAVLAALVALIGDAGVGLALEAAAGVVAEAATQGVTITAPDRPGADRTRAAAEALAGVIAAGYATGASRAALQAAGPDVDPTIVGDAVRAHLAELGTSGNGWVADNIGGALTAAQNAGRTAVLEVNPPDRLVADERLDSSTCEPCKTISGTVFESLADALAAYPVAGHVACLGGTRCRGFAAPIWS